MAFRLGILQVERAAQSLQRVVVGLLELFEGAFELRRAFFNKLFEIALVVSIFKHQAPVFERAPDSQIEIGPFQMA